MFPEIMKEITVNEFCTNQERLKTSPKNPTEKQKTLPHA